MGATNAKGSAELWLDAAYETLVASGVNAVRIAALGERLNLSRASFYWFFKDRDALLEGLLARWRQTNTGSLVQRCNDYAETIVEATLNVIDCWFRDDVFDTRLEFAIRSWAIQSPETRAEMQAADNTRIDAIKNMLMRFSMAEDTADVRARSLYLIQIGYISSQVTEDMATRMRRIPEYVAMYTDVRPDARDLARFHARIGFHHPNPHA